MRDQVEIAYVWRSQVSLAIQVSLTIEFMLGEFKNRVQVGEFKYRVQGGV